MQTLVMTDIIFSGLFAILLFGVFFGIRCQKISPKMAALKVFLLLVIFKIGSGLLQESDPLEIVCTGALLTLSFVPATYFFGVGLERWISKKGRE